MRTRIVTTLRVALLACGVFLPAVLRAQNAPAGARARCRDGTYSSSAHRRGTCSHHGGVAQWLSPSAPPADTTRAAPATAAGASQQASLTASEAKAHVGETATVCGIVASTRYAATSRGQPTFLNLDQPYPTQVFTIVIWGSARGAFPTAPEVAYRDRRVCVTELIDTYRGGPEVVVSSPEAIRVVSR
ncbi:MAG TPA: DUF3761 domain-containing protein [Gemmatimonadales bacterium]|jgi:hypothetical protein|nr:DUF3761 domain-containing protein [Gemmatimonadales bacterium]